MDAADHFMVAAVVLLLTLALALFRAWFGPRAIDHVMAAQLVATSGVGVALTLGAVELAREYGADVEAEIGFTTGHEGLEIGIRGERLGVGQRGGRRLGRCRCRG